MNELTLSIFEDSLCHHGILGMKWGVRRYQNSDGSLTAAGKRRYGVEGSRTKKNYKNLLNDLDEESTKSIYEGNKIQKNINKLQKQKTKAEKKNDVNKVERLKNQIRTETSKRDKAYATSEKIDSQTWKVIADAVSSGYDVSSKDVARLVDAGARFFGTGLIGALMYAPVANEVTVMGKQYKITKSKNNIGNFSFK